MGNTPVVSQGDLTGTGNGGGIDYPGLVDGAITFDPNKDMSDSEIMMKILTSPDNNGGLPKEYIA